MRVGLVGVGRIGASHAEDIRDHQLFDSVDAVVVAAATEAHPELREEIDRRTKSWG